VVRVPGYRSRGRAVMFLTVTLETSGLLHVTALLSSEMKPPVNIEILKKGDSNENIE
jgi:hypothetical protein